jgi:hypothetical protein
MLTFVKGLLCGLAIGVLVGLFAQSTVMQAVTGSSPASIALPVTPVTQRPSQPSNASMPTMSASATASTSSPTGVSGTSQVGRPLDERATTSSGSSPQTKSAPGNPDQLFSHTEQAIPPESSSVDEVAELHSAYRISCQFGPGVNAQVENTITHNEASWQGGVVTFDVLDAPSGRATMSGTAGATGSSSGVVEVRMAGSAASVSFSAVVPNGHLITTTVYARRNEQGQFLAAMSTHAVRIGHMASQFYGACDVH